jgi:rSAM/selenodomain-associated transferase 1
VFLLRASKKFIAEMAARTLLMIFARAPLAGEVNTRLIPDIGVAAATALQRELIEVCMEKYGDAAQFDVQLWCSPDIHHEVFQDCARQHEVSLHQQQGRDLGARMSHAFSTAFTDYDRAALIGTDAPALDAETVSRALDALDTNDVVSVPAEDGGYVLIAMRQHYDKVFLSVPWGGSHVLRKTRGNIVAQALRYQELETCWDIDRLEDYQRYRNMKNLFFKRY